MSLISRLFTVSFVSYLWRRFIRHRFRGMAFLLIAVFFVNFIHSEVKEYLAATNQTEFIQQVFWFKWLAWVIAISIYLILVERATFKSSQTKPQNIPLKKEHKTMARETESDGFDDLRDKQNLQTKAQKILGTRDDNSIKNNQDYS